MPETLREKASKKLKGPGANPSQLGDPISLKAETSDNVPTTEEGGAQSSSSLSPATSEGTGVETLRQGTASKPDNLDSNPGQPSDPASAKKERNPGASVNSEQGAPSNKIVKRDPKL